MNMKKKVREPQIRWTSVWLESKKIVTTCSSSRPVRMSVRKSVKDIEIWQIKEYNVFYTIYNIMHELNLFLISYPVLVNKTSIRVYHTLPFWKLQNIPHPFNENISPSSGIPRHEEKWRETLTILNMTRIPGELDSKFAVKLGLSITKWRELLVEGG